MDLIRTLLLKLEALPSKGSSVIIVSGFDPQMAIESFTPDEIEYHLRLLHAEKFLDSPGTKLPMAGVTFRGLTWAGHDFLDSVRDDGVWRKTKSGAEAAGGFTIDLLAGLAKAILKAKIKELSGLDL
jgi:hypothetical protein